MFHFGIEFTENRLFFLENLLCFYNVVNISAEKEKKKADAWIFEAQPKARRQKCVEEKEKEGKEEVNSLMTDAKQRMLRTLRINYSLGSRNSQIRISQNAIKEIPASNSKLAEAEEKNRNAQKRFFYY